MTKNENRFANRRPPHRIVILGFGISGSRTVESSKGNGMISPHPPDDDRDYECRCARCGSETRPQRCEQCNGKGVSDFEDDGVETICYLCDGQGEFEQCMKTVEVCKANPLPGRSQINIGELEWLLITEKPS